MEILGYVASVIIGISLGLIGGGGSILTVPVLVYFLHVDPVTATAYSLFIVGTTSLVGVFPKYRRGFVSIKTAIVFGIPSIISVYLTRKVILPAIPEHLFTIDGLNINKSLMIMLLFAILMITASFSMIREKNIKPDHWNEAEQSFNYPLIIIEGLLVGILTGLVGAGGGFLIIPALVMLSRLPMKTAVGTSLLIIAAKSLIGFLGDVDENPADMDWVLLLMVTVLAVGGIFAGNIISRKTDSKKLKKGFGWFVLVMGIYIIGTELLKGRM